MIKLLAFLFSSAALYVASIFFDEKTAINIKQTVPAEISQGEEFTISITIDKGNLSGFARLQQFLPKGFTAEELDNRKAEFINDEESAKFIWIAMPVENSFTVSYKVKPHPSLTGKHIFNGVFYFIQNEKTEKVALEPFEIKIGNTSAAIPGQPVIERKLISVNPDKGIYRVELIIEPQKDNQSAQFIDEIPKNFIAEPIENFGSEFTFDQNKAIFTWKKFPSEEKFKISYLVKSESATKAPEINGMLVYGEKESSEEDRKLEVSNEVNNPDSIIEELIRQENNNGQAIHIESEKSVSASSDNTFNIQDAQKGIYYKVQICATRKSSSKDGKYFEGKYKITDQVELTEHDGWKKYIIGGFSDYREAQNFKNLTLRKIGDAFVVAYENGIRIPVDTTQPAQAFAQ